MDGGQIAATSQGDPLINSGEGHPQQPDLLIRGRPAHGHGCPVVFNEAHHANDRGGLDGTRSPIRLAGFVVERNITAGDRSAQGTAGFRHPLAGLGQGPIALRGFRGGEVEVIGDRQGLSPDTAQVTGRFRHRRLAPLLRIQGHPAVVAVHGERQPTVGGGHGLGTTLRTQANHRSISSARTQNGVALNLVVVLLPDPPLAGHGGIIQHGLQHLQPTAVTLGCPDAVSRGRGKMLREPGPGRAQCRGGILQQGAVDHGGVVGQGRRRHGSHHVPMVEDAHHGVPHHLPHHCPVESPAVETGHHRVFAPRPHHQKHAFLRLG